MPKCSVTERWYSSIYALLVNVRYQGHFPRAQGTQFLFCPFKSAKIFNTMLFLAFQFNLDLLINSVFGCNRIQSFMIQYLEFSVPSFNHQQPLNRGKQYIDEDTGYSATLKGAWSLLSLSAVDKEDSQPEQTVPSQEMACFPTEEAVISVSRLINPWVSCYCTLPAIWPSQHNPAGHSSTPHALPDALKAAGCLPVERQILHKKLN